MILSGYLMAHGASETPRQGEWRQFYLRRFFRIAPLYYVVLLAVTVSPWVQEGYRAWGAIPIDSPYLVADRSALNLAAHATFLFGLVPSSASTTLLPDWSLSLEAQFYAAFPVIWIAMRRWSAERVAIVLSVACLPFSAALRAFYIDPSFLPLQLTYFLIGILLSEARRRPPLAALAITLSCVEAGIYGAWTVVGPFVTILITAFGHWELKPLRALFDNRVVKAGADLSYGVYLLHGFFIAAAGFFHPPIWLLIPWTILGATMFSVAANRLVERPAISFGRKIGSGKPTAAAIVVPVLQ